jgi:hypothetical protein
VIAANGVIHVIDAVLLPPGAPGLPRTGRAATPASPLAVAAPLLLGAGLAAAGWRRVRGRRPQTEDAAAGQPGAGAAP